VSTSHPLKCSLLREWNESIGGIEAYYDLIPPITNHFLEQCFITRPEGEFWYPKLEHGSKMCAHDDKFPLDHVKVGPAGLTLLFDNEDECCSAFPDACASMHNT